jgi:Tol biopolymer transport system component
VSTSTPESNTANNQASATTVINLPVATFVQLTNTISRVVQQQVLSRDGLKLAFISTADLTGQNPLGREALFVINSDGTGTRQLAVSPLDYDPNRSPSFGGPSLSGDGSKVAFTLLTASFGSDLWIINSDGTGAGRLATSSASFLGFPSISSDGTKIAFFIQNRIEIINSDGTGNFSLAFVSVATPPFISGDGSKVFFVASSEIFRVNADGTSLFQVTHLSQVGLFVFPGSLSVDYLGQKVTFITGGTAVLSVINSDGTGFLQLGVLGANLSSASISDDGRKIAFSSPFKVGDGFGPEQIYLIDVNGGNLRQITSVTSFGCFRPKLDATGTRVSFLSSADLTGQNADNSPELFLANVTPP